MNAANSENQFACGWVVWVNQAHHLLPLFSLNSEVLSEQMLSVLWTAPTQTNSPGSRSSITPSAWNLVHSHSRDTEVIFSSLKLIRNMSGENKWRSNKDANNVKSFSLVAFSGDFYRLYNLSTSCWSDNIVYTILFHSFVAEHTKTVSSNRLISYKYWHLKLRQNKSISGEYQVKLAWFNIIIRNKLHMLILTVEN